MFSKVFASLSVLLAISVQVNAHAAIAPALGVDGTPVRADVQRPSTASPCGTVNVASTLDTSTPVQAAADGTFTATATDFNAGADGSRSVTAKVDPTAQGKTFSTAVTVSQNGDAAPTTVGSDQIVAALPAGTTCSGGTAGNLCLVQFTTTAGFGNCVVVAQGAATGAAAANTTAAATNGTTTAGTTATNGTTTATNGTTDATTAANGTTAATTTTTKHHHHKAAAAQAKVNKIESRGEEALHVVKRGVLSWVWA
ncbi:uncharacterized protein C8R40DRAFT_1131130 [Lentinula edodes]|uniref:uncharacterized protein n=1 Tax=Lentinula edodes TaxID=5353 RepID=UPI001E8D9F7C|nr:uncharacterized protein C8R40DRAFT_1131130 [Lentinula edodes]KAH7869308.1 hypothetical protein C8R40DRAFT_1131130 [Lentinula edodes]